MTAAAANPHRKHSSLLRRVVWLAWWALAIPCAQAQSQFAAGDMRLRSDLQLLADSGVISLPLTTWPIPVDEVAIAIDGVDGTELADPSLQAALERVRDAASAREAGRSLWAAASVSGNPTRLRTFEDTPRSSGEVSAAAAMVGEHWDGELKVAAAASPQDGHILRLDGSLLQAVLGNWLLGVSTLDRWWGPAWDGSLILSNAARPIPGLMLERRTSLPFNPKALHWIGPWRVSVLLGQLEHDRLPVQSPLFLAARIVAKPLPWLELAVSRSIIFCGTDRPCGLSIWTDAIFERQAANGTEGPNDIYERLQLAGFDLRLNSPWPQLPAALYAQTIGEDAKDLVPFKLMAIFGAEGWHDLNAGDVIRAHVEYTDTACSYYRPRPLYGCAYSIPLYAGGDRYLGFPIGDSLDGDSQVISFGAQYIQRQGTTWGLLLRSGRLNRGDAEVNDSLTGVPEKIREGDLTWRRSFGFNDIEASVGLLHTEQPSLAASAYKPQAFLSWKRLL
jgi:Capsule assembly protein Wzi